MSGALKQDFVKIYMPWIKILAVTPIKINSVFYQLYLRLEYNFPWGCGIHSPNYILHWEEPERSNALCDCKGFYSSSRLVLNQTASKMWSNSKLRVFGNPLETWRGVCCCWAAWTYINGLGCWKCAIYIRRAQKELDFFSLNENSPFACSYFHISCFCIAISLFILSNNGTFLTVRKQFETLTIEVLVTKRQRSFAYLVLTTAESSKDLQIERICCGFFSSCRKKGQLSLHACVFSVIRKGRPKRGWALNLSHSLRLIHVCALGIFMLRIAVSYPAFSIYPFKEWDIN